MTWLIGRRGQRTLRRTLLIGAVLALSAFAADCGGTSVRANLVNIEADPEHVKLGMPLKLTTFAIGKDDDGVEAINFGFEPAA